MDMAMEHLRRAVAHKGSRAVVEMRKHVAWYLKGMRGAAALRARVNAATTLEDMLALLERGE